MVADAVRALDRSDVSLAQSVIDRDQLANRLQTKIDSDAMRILALRNPMATDLRRTIGAIRVAADLERIGDLAEGIAKRVLNLDDHGRPDIAKMTIIPGLERMGRQVKAQLSAALDAFLRDDIDTAVQVWLSDEDTDAMYNAILHNLLKSMAEDSRQINASTALLFTAKNLERIGDHTSNICEAIYFTNRGQPLIEDSNILTLLKSNT
jgi:phosphate transport system protein